MSLDFFQRDCFVSCLTHRQHSLLTAIGEVVVAGADVEVLSGGAVAEERPLERGRGVVEELVQLGLTLDGFARAAPGSVDAVVVPGAGKGHLQIDVFGVLQVEGGPGHRGVLEHAGPHRGGVAPAAALLVDGEGVVGVGVGDLHDVVAVGT